MGSQPSPPTLDTEASKALTEEELKLKLQYTPLLAEATGAAGREEYARNLGFALQGFTDPASVVYAGQIEDLNEKNRELNKDLAKLGPKQGNKRREIQTKIDANNSRIAKLRQSDPVGDLTKTFSEEFTKRNELLGAMKDAGKSSQEYFRMQRAMRSGLDPNLVKQQKATAATSQAATANIVKGPRAAMADNVRDISAGQVGTGALGQTLMNRAMEGVRAGGRLDAEANRDAVQSARQSMAARGMATGMSGAAAELLNRDRYRRSREMEDLGFASGVQGQDLQRQFQNVGNTLTADQSNQEMAGRLSLADQDAINRMRAMGYEGLIGQRQFNASNRQQANLANMQAINAMRQFNTGLAADTDRFNAAQTTDAQRFNVGMLQSSALASDNERARQLGLGQSAYNFALQTNPKMMLAGLGSPYANFTPQALGLMSSTNVQPIYTGGSPGTYGTNMAFLGSVLGGGMAAAGQIYGARA